jgi:predicted methyltransferase
MSIEYKSIAGFVAALLLITACEQKPADDQGPVPEAVSTMTASVDESVYAMAQNHPARSEADRERDALRKPAEVMQFFGVGPGMTVLDVHSGGGYYSELLSYVVGAAGSVTAHTNAAYLRFTGDETAARYAAGRLPNVEVLVAENNELSLPDGKFDAVMMILTYHDIYYVNPEDGWPKIDGPAMLAELYAGMKPGAILGIVDHVAETGSPVETGGTLHRIDPAIIRAEVEAAGFQFEAEAHMLRNAEDDHLKSVFDPAIRSHTDQVVMRFRKPG